MYTPGKTRSWENDARQLARIEMGSRAPLDGPLRMTVRAMFAPPENWPKWKLALLDGDAPVWHIRSKDADNILKAASDALIGVVFLDDKLIVEAVVTKTYTNRPRVEIKVERCRGWHSDSKRGDEQ